MNLLDKVILITGAGTGLGKALALAAGQVGAKVICAGRRKDKIQQTADEVSKAGGTGTAVEMDVTDLKSIEKGLKMAEKVGPIDILINNAGIITGMKAVQDLPVEEWDKIMATNVRGPYLLIRAILPGMIQRGFGRILNISAPIKHLPKASAYCASKCALDSLTKAVGYELKGVDVIINAVEPPFLDTEMHKGGKKPEEVVAQILELVALEAGSQSGRIVKIG
ncbi:MAG: SDR family oxidoreductase [Candidatus Pacebacteria bacterium]|nr:SDR family oxidoreductase [Candidatus Paceibacterota bacterium]